jgi:hypothetical protein
MAKKGHAPGPVPPGNRPQAGPGAPPPSPDEEAGDQGAPFSDQDPKRRLGGYETAGEHSYVQPGGLNDADHQVGGERNPTGRSADK